MVPQAQTTELGSLILDMSCCLPLSLSLSEGPPKLLPGPTAAAQTPPLRPPSALCPGLLQACALMATRCSPPLELLQMGDFASLLLQPPTSMYSATLSLSPSQRTKLGPCFLEKAAWPSHTKPGHGCTNLKGKSASY